MGDMITPELRVGKDGTRRWRVRYRIDRQQGSQTFLRDRDADQFARWINRFGAAEAVRLLGQAQGGAVDDPTLAEWCKTHIDRLTGVTAGTVARYRSYAKNDLGTLGEIPLKAITPTMIGAWVTTMENAGSSGKTIKNKHGFVSAVMASAVDNDLISANPCRGTRLPRTVTRSMTFLTHDEYTRFLGCFTDEWRPLVETMFATGLRWGEISALRVGDLDLDSAALTVAQAWKYASGAGWSLGAPKSMRSRRTITLPSAIVDLLRIIVDGRPGDALVFTAAKGEPIRQQRFHEQAWQPAVKLANGEKVGKREPLTPPLGKTPRPHDARHTCASWLLGAGVPINYVQAHLGHESITTTVDRYGHVMPQSRQVIAAALDFALSASNPQLES